MAKISSPQDRKQSDMKRRFGSVEEIERVLFPRLYKERRKSKWLSRELQESDEALALCEEAHGASVEPS